jgi:hypothetical protein
MFDDLDASLKSLLTDPAAPSLLSSAAVSFETPSKEFTASSPTVNLFLFSVQENRELRVTGPDLQWDAENHRYASRAEPLRVDCTYLLTAWSIKQSAAKVAEEHQLLGLTLSWVSRFPVLPPQHQVGSLAQPQRYPITTLVARLEPPEALNQFWTALGIAPRPTFAYTATVEMPFDDRVDPYDPVRRIVIQEAEAEGWVLSGHVRDGAGAPLPFVTVTVRETGNSTTTDANGAYQLTGLPFGQYTVQVVAPGKDAGPPSQVDYSPTQLVQDLVLSGP